MTASEWAGETRDKGLATTSLVVKRSSPPQF
jgi:hypothetical protein